ncbi:DegT/DnrJ/EryC1/StrS family aminotransferase [Tamlana sp. 2201CG12-4]|uniref:DegT/DnrJ/EryC1/StrS family aminotransferase n=1 Tax=Tamlana sp. 2201CG12-4 TaxID=3112582 RepID=UPI002DBDD47E|nr:DegT/DnrJ/EryC1/StrS family aminotransferase [Tamlana sp. 2201CG12-4]MEC3907244.1 DegT/DnrJ/EryC1/StrS family aminotransferase [Tamlana sp. 2201CG12-4]
MIKFLDLQKINARFQKEFEEQFKQFLNSGQYVLGSQVSKFENNFAAYCGTKYCVGVSNGLDALILIFKAYVRLGVLKRGDEVIVPGNTYIASILAIEAVGLSPVLVDPDFKTYNISVSEIEKKITPKTRVVLVVHLYGMLANMEEISTLSKKNNLLVFEDAAQAHGAINHKGIKAGNMSDAAAFSFYPSKNLGAIGDAGAIVSNNEVLINIIRQLRNYGSDKKYIYETIGANNRLDEIQAVFLNIKLKLLDNDNIKRRDIAKLYLSKIANKKVKLPFYDLSDSHVFYAFVVLVEDREKFMTYMSRYAIETLIHYPIPPHKQKAFAHLKKISLPITERIHNEVVSLPISPVMTTKDIECVIKVINKY